MLKKIELYRALKLLRDGEEVYMMKRISGNNAIKELFDSDGFVLNIEENQPEEQPEEKNETKEPVQIPGCITAAVPRKQTEEPENVIDKMMPLVTNKTVKIINEEAEEFEAWDWDRVEQMLADGMSAADIARHYGMNYQTVWGRIDRHMNK